MTIKRYKKTKRTARFLSHYGHEGFMINIYFEFINKPTIWWFKISVGNWEYHFKYWKKNSIWRIYGTGTVREDEN